MPATRSSSQQPRTVPFPNPSPPHSQASRTKKKIPKSDSLAEIISLPSEGESSSAGALRPKRNASANNKKPAAIPRSKGKIALPEDIIEISSDDESDSPLAAALPRRQPTAKTTELSSSQDPAAIADFRRQISRYRDETAKCKRDLDKACKELSTLREENKELQLLRKPGNNKVSLDTDKISDHLDCEICTTRMWAPYVLPDCGHTFCQSCLGDWFAQTQAQYINSHPHYNPNALMTNPAVNNLYQVVQSIIINPHAANHPHVKALLNQTLPQHPEYTCPTCREPITSRPTESFVVKAMVRTVAAALGECSPKKPSTGRGKAAANASGPWDGYFPFKKV
ncbi:hypothetical protein CPB83DRAFT_854310 [Crepidotus variabilis]|uniref:RING-type domain-containing protein n=1 Tax=Crepidotus variabilis TaxID=179855 RepID=A0A9P6EGE4_9AGAR|nr:hypothetical protein CPB83DRAFT_854310 [Crepidotus variabilis]